jgi:hypothetical protein
MDIRGIICLLLQLAMVSGGLRMIFDKLVIQSPAWFFLRASAVGASAVFQNPQNPRGKMKISWVDS